MAPRTIVYKRQFGVWLEDAFELVLRPEDEEEIADEYDGDLEAWALGNEETFYSRCRDPEDGHCTLMWEDSFKADLDFPDTEREVEIIDMEATA